MALLANVVRFATDDLDLLLVFLIQLVETLQQFLIFINLFEIFGQLLVLILLLLEFFLLGDFTSTLLSLRLQLHLDAGLVDRTLSTIRRLDGFFVLSIVDFGDKLLLHVVEPIVHLFNLARDSANFLFLMIKELSLRFLSRLVLSRLGLKRSNPSLALLVESFNRLEFSSEL